MRDDIPQGDIRYDAAAANMESPCRMSTKAQCDELINNTTSEWTSMNGVNGYKFTNKSNSNKYIFLPAAGNWYESTHNMPARYGRYWSTTWNSSTNACNIRFDSNIVRVETASREMGFSIRGIQ